MPPERVRTSIKDNPAVMGLFKDFSRAKSPQEKERKAEEIVRGATGAFDALSTLRALAFAQKLIQEGKDKESGIRITTGIINYFIEADVCAKFIVPGQELSLAPVQEVLTLTSHSYNPSPIISDFISVSRQVAEDELKLLTSPNSAEEAKKGAHYFIFVINERERATKPSYMEAKQAFVDTLSTSGGVLSPDLSNSEELKVPERLVSLAQYAPTSEGFPNILKRKFGGISLEEVLAENTDEETFTKKALQFMANVTRGDLSWQKIIRGTLLAHLQPTPNFPLESLANPNLLWKIFSWQTYVSEKLLSPAVLGEDVDPEFNRLLSQALSNLDRRNCTLLGISIYHSQTRIIMAEQMLGISSGDLIERMEYYPIIKEAHVKDGRVAFIEKSVQNLLRANADKIYQDWRKRFPQSPRLDRMIEGVSFYVEQNLDKKLTELFEKEMRENLGINFLNNIKGKEGEFEEVSQMYWDDIPKDPKTSYWPTPTAIHGYNYSHGSLPEIMGFQRVQFYTEENILHPVTFTLLPPNPERTPLIGKIDPSGKITDLSADFRKDYPALGALIEQVAIVSFREFLIRERIKAKPKEQTAPELPPQTPQASEEPKQPQKKKKRLSLRTLPRAVIEKDEHSLDSETIKRELNQEFSQRTRRLPREVDMHKSDLRGTDTYIRLIKMYNNAPEEGKAVIGPALERARESMYKASQGKVKNLPPGFQLENVVDPLTRETYYKETWVINHSNPKPTPDDLKSPAQMYKKYYRGQPSAFAYLDWLKTLIVS